MMCFFKSITLVFTGLVIALTITPPPSAIATLHRPHPKLEKKSPPNPEPNLIATADTSQGTSQIIELPDTGAQNDEWSCGPNSAARVLRYYGHNVDYAIVRAATDKKLFLPEKIRNPFTNQWIDVRTGTPPLTLQQVMQRWEGDRVKRSAKSNFNRMINMVRSGKPVIALIRVGGFKVAYIGSIPYLHWIAITGADSQLQQIYYTDTNSQNYAISYQDFQSKWNLGLDQNGLDKAMSGAITNILKNNGVEPRTIVWVDRN